MLSVTILCPNNHRVILDEACKKQGFVSETYGLKHQNKFVDLSLPFRLTGLPQNCTLEMEEHCDNVKEEVEIALQMPDGNRLTNKIPTDATLLDLLLDFEKQSGSKLLEPEGEDVHPVCQYLNNEYVGVLSLAATTLKSMGIRGKALFRFAFRQVSADQMEKINETIERRHVKQRKLEATFEKKFQENKMNEQKKEEEAALINQLASSAPLSSVVSDPQPMDVATSSSTSNAVSPISTASAAAPSQVQSNFNERQAKLDALQQMLSMVDQSIQENTDLPWDFDNRMKPVENNNGPDFSNFKFPEETKGLDLRSSQRGASENADSAVQPCDRRSVAYRMDDKLDIEEQVYMNLGVIEAPSDEFFDVTTNDVKLQQKRLQEQAIADGQRAMFPPSVIRQREFENKVKSWKFSVIRIQFPDGVILQGTFHSLEPVSAVYQFVKENLANDKITFKLCCPPNLVYDKFEANLIQLNLAPRSTLFFRVRLRDAPFVDGLFLKREILESLKSQAEAELTAHECLLLNQPYVPYRPPTVQSENPPSCYEENQTAPVGRQTAPKGTAELPKWFKKT